MSTVAGEPLSLPLAPRLAASAALAELRLPTAGQALLLAAMAAMDRRWQARRVAEAPPP